MRVVVNMIDGMQAGSEPDCVICRGKDYQHLLLQQQQEHRLQQQPCHIAEA